MHQPRVLLIRTAGTNCDAELAHAFTLAGAAVQPVHLDTLIREPQRLDDAEIIAFPGGFSYGDDIASGRIVAAKLKDKLLHPLQHAIARGALVLGVCNGFQVLVQTGLLPRLRDPAAPTDAPPAQTIALTDNASARFQDEWAEMVPDPDSPCLWTRPLAERARALEPADRRHILRYPIAHAEGRVIAKDHATLDALEHAHQIPLRYATDINGSDRDIAALCDPTGRVFGLMPHPERYLAWQHHPYWTRLPTHLRSGDTPGLMIFQAAVEAARNTAHSPAPSLNA